MPPHGNSDKVSDDFSAEMGPCRSNSEQTTVPPRKKPGRIWIFVSGLEYIASAVTVSIDISSQLRAPCAWWLDSRCFMHYLGVRMTAQFIDRLPAQANIQDLP